MRVTSVKASLVDRRAMSPRSANDMARRAQLRRSGRDASGQALRKAMEQLFAAIACVDAALTTTGHAIRALKTAAAALTRSAPPGASGERAAQATALAPQMLDLEALFLEARVAEVLRVAAKEAR